MKVLRVLLLGRTKITSAGWNRLENLKKLEQLDVQNHPFNDNDLAKLAADHPRLTVLCLIGTQVTDAGLRHVAKLERLVNLKLPPITISDAGAEHVAKLGELNVLLLNRVTDNGLKSIANLPKLQELDLGLSTLSDAAAGHLAKSPQLRSLKTRNALFTDTGAKTLSRMNRLANLELHASQITPAAVAKLRKALPKAQIVWSPVQPEAMAAEQVFTWGGKVGVDYMGQRRSVASSADMAGLSTRVAAIDLTERASAIGDEAALEMLSFLGSLDYLRLDRAGITDAALKYLPKPALRDLSLAGNPITDAGLPQLKQLSNLTSLDLRQTKITPAGVQSLKSTLPKCNIQYSSE